MFHRNSGYRCHFWPLVKVFGINKYFPPVAAHSNGSFEKRGGHSSSCGKPSAQMKKAGEGKGYFQLAGGCNM